MEATGASACAGTVGGCISGGCGGRCGGGVDVNNNGTDDNDISDDVAGRDGVCCGVGSSLPC